MLIFPSTLPFISIILNKLGRCLIRDDFSRFILLLVKFIMVAFPLHPNASTAESHVF